MKYKSRQRDIILEQLKMVDCHPTADEVYIMVKRKLPKIGIATVYRNLEQLSKGGCIFKLDGDIKRYDGNIMRHFHYRCPQCERVFDLDIGKLESIYDDLSNESHKQGLEVKVEFVRICENCIENKGK
ncbi:MAG: transcriptional repressor [Kiritimatiellae bacterium]|jgi:Fur family ferric uptake transcriptional regulator|nr:transcriptional repressor [Kiritimatiellia bacterium]